MFGSSHGRGSAIAVANIESSNVSFSVIKLHSNGSATIEISHYAELPLEERESGQHLFALKQRLADIGKTALAEYAAASLGHAIKKMYAIVHAPWSYGTIVHAARGFPQDAYISSAVIADCAAKALAEHSASPEYLDVRQLPIMLNGYLTTRPEGKYAHLIEVSALMSTCDDGVRKEIEATMHELLPAAKLMMHSGVRAVIEALELTRPHASDALCLHVSGEGTEIILVRGGIAESCAYIPEGLRTMLARAFPAVRPEEARTAVRLMQRQEGTDAGNVETQEALLKAEPDMAHAYGEGLAKLSAEMRLPNTAFLIADADIAPWLQKFFERIDFSQFTVTAQPLNVDIISASEFGSISDGKEKSGDLHIAIATSHILNEEGR